MSNYGILGLEWSVDDSGLLNMRSERKKNGKTLLPVVT